jgi:hypothetical protein
MTVKERLHRLVDTLPEGELHTAERFLEYLRNTPGAVDPVLWAHLRAPLDDLPADADDLDGELTAARAEPSVSHEEARRVLLGDA